MKYSHTHTFIYVKRQGCTEGQACNRAPHTHTYNTHKKNYMDKKNNTKTINLKIHKKYILKIIFGK